MYIYQSGALKTIPNLKKEIIFFITLFILSSHLFAQKTNFKFDFTIIFGGCFQDDSVTLNINSVVFANKIILKSNVVGSASFSITQDKKGISVKHYQMARFILQKINIKAPINLNLSINDKSVNSIFNLKKGKIIYIEYCWDKNKKRQITVQQQDYPVYFL